MHNMCVVLAVMLFGCTSANYGIPKTAKKHCEEQAEELIQKHASDRSGDVKACAFLKLNQICTEAMYRHAAELDKKARTRVGSSVDPWFFIFPGEWELDALEDTLERQQDAFDQCSSAANKAEALRIIQAIGAASGAIDWPNRGSAARGRPGMCRDCQ
jgi:hypothetical protein